MNKAAVRAWWMLIVVICASGDSLARVQSPPHKAKIVLSIVKIEKNLLDEQTPGMEHVKYGNDGGEVVRDGKGMYHWFTSEQTGDPYTAETRLTHWTSEDGYHWNRDTTWSKDGNHDLTNTRDKATYYDPSMVYDPDSGYWYMFYVAYRFSPQQQCNRAKIFRAKAVKPGMDGLDEPYHDNDADDVMVLEPQKNPPPYEAQWVGDTHFGYGAASATVYRVGRTWYMLWAENLFATAPAVTAPFTRLPEGVNNPVRFERKPMHWYPDYIRASLTTAPYAEFYFENPIIAHIPPGSRGAGNYIMVVGYYTDFSLGVKHRRSIPT